MLRQRDEAMREHEGTATADDQEQAELTAEREDMGATGRAAA
jgi:hypothetical protein